MRDELQCSGSSGSKGETQPVLRKGPPIRVQFRSLGSEARLVEGEGILIDLTREGGRVLGDVPVQTGTQLKLRIYLPKRKSSIDVELSAVRWARGRQFGLEFLRMRGTARNRLRRVVQGFQPGVSE